MATKDIHKQLEERREALAVFLGVPVEKLAETLKELTPPHITKHPPVVDTENTYHDVEVGCNNYVYRMFDVPFSHDLRCCRSAGWELWDVAANGGDGKRLGGEYHNKPFEIRLHDKIICNNRFILPADPALVKEKLGEHHLFSLGLIECETIWHSWDSVLTVVLPSQQWPYINQLCKSLVKYINRFGGVSWAGYFWSVESINETPSPARHGFQLKISEPKTDSQ